MKISEKMKLSGEKRKQARVVAFIIKDNGCVEHVAWSYNVKPKNEILTNGTCSPEAQCPL